MPCNAATPPILTERFDKALLMATDHHRQQLRKGTPVPYVSHILAVTAIVIEMRGTEDEAIGAVLHDLVEDGGGAEGLENIRLAFGEAVAEMVAANSDTDEDPKPPWPQRKAAYVAAIPHKTPSALRVSLADKLHNARCILADYREHGEELWGRFNMRAGEPVREHLRALTDAFEDQRRKLGSHARPVLDALRQTVDELDRLATAVDVVRHQGRASKGSRFQLQRSVNDAPQDLEAALGRAAPDLAGAVFEWRSPLEVDAYREYRDAAFLQALDLAHLVPKLEAFWPSRGPVWDGLALVRREGQPDGVLLVEAKAHVDELLKGSGSAATARRSIELICARLEELRADLEVEADVEMWFRGPSYQHANRLAHARWLNIQGVPTWFVHVLFADDPTHISTTRRDLEGAMREADARLGVGGSDLSWSGHVVVPAHPDLGRPYA